MRGKSFLSVALILICGFLLIIPAQAVSAGSSGPSCEQTDVPTSSSLPGYTEQLVKYVMGINYEDIPQAGIERAKLAMIDTVGVALLGSKEPSSKLIAEFVKSLGTKPQAGIIGHGFYTSLSDAALANGLAAHAMDFDDDWAALGPGHASAVLVPVILSLAKEYRITGKEAIAAYVAGFEAWARMTNAMGSAYNDHLGWHPTAPRGHLAAAITAAKLMKLNERQALMAFGLAGSMASGLRVNFGTMTKPYHLGNAARSGIVAAQLAKSGFTASVRVLEGDTGFLHAFDGGKDYNEAVLIRNMNKGNSFAIISSGLVIKQFDACAGAQRPIRMMLQLVKEHNIRPDEVAGIEYEVPYDPPRSLVHYRPKTGLEGKFSMQYVTAAVILDGKVNSRTFTDEQVLRPEAQKLFPKINMHRRTEDIGKPNNYNRAPTIVVVTLTNGQIYTTKEENTTPSNDKLKEIVVDKYWNTAGLVLKKGLVDRTLDIMLNLEKNEPFKLVDILTKTGK
jgi:2-methylcitrate dehydratase PrpD